MAAVSIEVAVTLMSIVFGVTLSTTSGAIFAPASAAPHDCDIAGKCVAENASAKDHMLLQWSNPSLGRKGRQHQGPPTMQSGERIAHHTAGSSDMCHTLLEGEGCYTDVLWAMVHGIYNHPEWYPESFTPATTFDEFQGYLHNLYPDLCPLPCERPVLRSKKERCVSRAVALNLTNVVHSNLGGKGPDGGDETYHFKHVGNASGRAFDLIIRATTKYVAKEPLRNKVRGKFGVINLKSGTSTDFSFSFEDAQSRQPVVLDAFQFSLLDLDQQTDVTERMHATDFESYAVSEGSEVAVEKKPDGSTVFMSTALGAGCDNPSDPMKLDQEVFCKGRWVSQQKRAVTLLYSNRSSFSLRYELPCSKKKCKGGRNFLFAGSTSLSYSCQEAPKLGLCVSFGDPHFVTFDGAHTVFMGHRVIWLVRSRDVWIQALSRDHDGKFVAIAVGGSFVRNRTLIVNKTSPWELQTVFDGADILSNAQNELYRDDVLEAYRSEEWNATLHNDDILRVRTHLQFSVGPWPERFLDRPIGGLLLFRFPGGVEMTVSGVDTMSVAITMPPQPSGQSGYCGNFNGDAEDEYERVRPSFDRPIGSDLGPVPADQVLFKLGSWEEWTPGANDNQTWLDPGSILGSCNLQLMDVASKRCERITDARLKQDCVMDVCATGLADAADGVLAAEIIELKVNARGIPIFMGHGQCIDSVGRQYASLSTHLFTVSDCTDILRSLALTNGVVGAQLQDAGNCQVLVTDNADPTDIQIKGGWGKKTSLVSGGQGLISNTTNDMLWRCWQLV